MCVVDTFPYVILFVLYFFGCCDLFYLDPFDMLTNLVWNNRKEEKAIFLQLEGNMDMLEEAKQMWIFDLLLN